MNKALLKPLMISTLFLTFNLSVKSQEGVVTIDQDKDIATLLEYKKDLKTVELYKIQLDQGNRTFAENLKTEFNSKYNEWPVEMVFETPNYKIWVGNFRSRLEADKALLKIKRNYIKAIIFQPKKDK